MIITHTIHTNIQHPCQLHLHSLVLAKESMINSQWETMANHLPLYEDNHINKKIFIYTFPHVLMYPISSFLHDESHLPSRLRLCPVIYLDSNLYYITTLITVLQKQLHHLVISISKDYQHIKFTYKLKKEPIVEADEILKRNIEQEAGHGTLITTIGWKNSLQFQIIIKIENDLKKTCSNPENPMTVPTTDH